MKPQRRPAVFLDKDGTLVENVAYNVDPDRLRLLPGAEAGVAALAAADYRLVIISNQPGVARGHFPESALVPVRARLASLFAGLGARLDGFYYCPHDPDGPVAAYRDVCRCRKPAPGLVQQACRDLDIDAARAWFVGDILDDIEAGTAAGCRTVLIDNGNETEWQFARVRLPHHVAGDLDEAARAILDFDGTVSAWKQSARARNEARPRATRSRRTGQHAQRPRTGSSGGPRHA